MPLGFGRTRGSWCFSGSVSADGTFSRCAGRETSFPLLWTATHPLAVTQEPGSDGVCAQMCLGPAEKQPVFVVCKLEGTAVMSPRLYKPPEEEVA